MWKGATTPVIKALSPTETGHVLFPHLESLTFWQLITEPTTIFPDLTEMARARGLMGSPLNKVSSGNHTAFRRSDVEALQRYVNCVELNTRADSPPCEPANAYSYSIATVRVFSGKYSSSRLCLSLVSFVPHFSRVQHQLRRRDLVGSRKDPRRREAYRAPTMEKRLSQVSLLRYSRGGDPHKGASVLTWAHFYRFRCTPEAWIPDPRLR